jgi:polyribonucleotide nucleotidyltransferase
VLAPLSVLPYIIGKKGATMKGIQEMSGAHIQIPKREDMEVASVVADEENEEDQVEITIEGIDAAVTKAKEELNKIINEKVCPPIDVLLISRLRKRQND